MDLILQKIGEALIGLLNEDLVYTVIAAMVLIQAGKLAISYCWRVPNTVMIWFVLSPLVSLPVAYFTWSYNDRVPWWIVALTAGFLANILFALILKNVVGRFAPEIYEKLNLPVDRRRRNHGPPSDGERRT